MGRNTALPPQHARFRLSAGAGPRREAGGRHPGVDDTGCAVLHADMDAFFAAVELRERPELAESPVVVAGSGARSVVLSANYPARTFGVRSAMALGQARRLCPVLVRLSPRKDCYAEISRDVLDIFREFTPAVEPLGLDEAYLDVAGALRRLGRSPAGVAADLRARVAAEHDLTCSVGVARVKFLAKLASGMAKPDGVVVVPAAEVDQFLHPLPASSLPGIGPQAGAALDRVGIATVGDVARTPAQRLARALGSGLATAVRELARGIDERDVIAEGRDKSIGAEQTFDTDHAEPARLARELLRLAEVVGGRLRAKGLRGRTVSIKLRFADFRTITRARTLTVPTDLAHDLYACASDLLAPQVSSAAPVRLLGIRAEGLEAAGAGQQLSLLGDAPRRRAAERAADEARSRFGAEAIRPGSLIS